MILEIDFFWDQGMHASKECYRHKVELAPSYFSLFQIIVDIKFVLSQTSIYNKFDQVLRKNILTRLSSIK